MTKYVIENKFGPQQIVGSEEEAQRLIEGKYKTTYRSIGLFEKRKVAQIRKFKNVLESLAA